MKNQEGFNYTYSAAQQEEIRQIRLKYLPKEEDKMAQLRKLHQLPTQKAQAWSIAFGVVGALILGVGMSLIMSEFGAPLGFWAIPLGIVLGVLGMTLAALAYPVYNHVLKKERSRIATQVLQLTDELLK